MRFKRKPLLVTAERFFKIGDAGVTKLWEKAKTEICEVCGHPINEHGKVQTAYRTCRMKKCYHTACPGDWIIIGVKGEKYPCKPDIFELSYEYVGDLA